MTASDEIEIQQAEIRHQYNLMIELKEKMNKEKELLELQIRENDVHLINRKRGLYQQWIFGLVDFDKGIKMVQTYHHTVQFDFRKFGKRSFRNVEESVIEKLYKREHDRNCYQRNLIFGCKIFPEYVDELRDAFDKAYDQYLSDGNIQPFANMIESYTPKSNERREYLVPKESAEIFSLHDYCMISEDDTCCKFLDKLLPNLTNLKAHPVGGGSFSQIGKWMFYTYNIDLPKNTMIFCDVGFHKDAPFDEYICHKYEEWSRLNCYADSPDNIREKKIRQLIKEFDLYIDFFLI